MADKAKLHYYQATGRAHAIRLALAASSIDWEDVYPEGGFPPSEEAKKNWEKIGGNTTTNVPMLVASDGKVYTQSSAVLRAVGRMGCLIPDSFTADDLYLMDKLIADAEDLRQKGYGAFVPWGATKEKVDAFIKEILPKHMGNIDRQLPEGNDFFVGNTLSIADITLYDAVTTLGINLLPEDTENGPLIDKFPKLKEWISRIESNAGISKYYESEEWKSMMKFDKSMLGY